MRRVKMLYLQQKVKGFSLLEVLLVLAIMGTIMVSLLSYTTQKSDEMRRDKSVMQVEQFLNAGLSYYANMGSWPTLLSQLQGGYLPNNTINNPWGQALSIGAANPGSQFFVCTTIIGKQAYPAATIIAGRLPIASAIDGTIACPTTSPVNPTACNKNSTTCTVVSSVNIPGQNLNNARSINFAGLYHNGACVPAPKCIGSMVATIFVVPVSVSGMNDNNTDVYPISSFSAYAIGTNTTTSSPPGATPLDCNGNTTINEPCPATTGNTSYWRVCLRIITQKGLVVGAQNPNWAQNASVILAFTRCMPSNESTIPQVSGSAFTVFYSN